MPAHYFTSQTPLLPADWPQKARSFSVVARSQKLEFLSSPSVFSKGEFDFGSRLLLDHLQIAPDARVCDLGCGWGALAAFVASTSPESKVWACDINPRAVQLADWNFRRNNINNVAAWCGDGLQTVRANWFDCIVCNPPVRAGNATIARLFEDSLRCLKPNGSLWVVLRTAQGAKSWQQKLAAQFGSCETVEMDKGYRVLRCEKNGTAL